jgi:hypothetical protein
MVGAVAGTPGTAPTNWIIPTASGNLTSREIVGTGTENGITYIDVRLVASGVIDVSIYTEPGSAVAGSNTQTWTYSAYVKLVGGSVANLTARIGVVENDSGGNFLAGGANIYVPTSAALATQRLSFTRINTNASTAFVQPRLRFEFTGAGDITLRIGLPQLEQGAFATSVIPTSTTAVTRSADVASITGSAFSGFYNQSEGTVFANGSVFNTSSNRFLFALTDATINEEIALLWSSVFSSLVTDGGATQANSFGGTVTANTRSFHSFGYKVNDFQGYGNGTALTTDTSGTLPTVDRMTIGSRVNSTFWANGTIRRLTYWPTRLSNSTLQSITL